MIADLNSEEVLHIVKSLCEAGTALAVMGNHEFNALGRAEPDGSGEFLRPHTPNNKEQHQELLRQIGEGSVAHRQALEWFRTLPVWLDLPGYVWSMRAGIRRRNRPCVHT